MDAIEKSSKFAEALTKVGNIPVLNKVVHHLSKKHENEIRVKQEAAEEIIEQELKDREQRE